MKLIAKTQYTSSHEHWQQIYDTHCKRAMVSLAPQRRCFYSRSLRQGVGVMKVNFYAALATTLATCFGFVGMASAQQPGDYFNDAVQARFANSTLVACDDCDAGCDAAAPACGCETAPDCGCETAAPSCGCGGGGCDSCCGGGGLGLDLGGCCDLGEPWTLFGENCRGIEVGGHLQFGYHNKNNGLFNNHRDRVNLHQMWLYAEKAADGGDCCWDFGWRVDAVYGVDGANTQSFGNNPGAWDYQNGFDHGSYGWAAPQAYVEADRGDLNIKAGHFYTLAGYEVVPATGNFFYSHAYTMNNSEPFTHTGVLATYDYNECTTLYAGWTAGWDTGFDQLGNGSSFLGGFSRDLTDDTSLTYITTFGDLGWNGEGYSHSIVIDTALSSDLNYVFQSDYVDTDTAGNQIGINQYLIYSVSDCLGVGGRVEWWRNNGVSWYEATAGLNYKPTANLTVRPEIRQEWNPSTNYDEVIFGIDAYLTF
jgi:hypothetical protein